MQPKVNPYSGKVEIPFNNIVAGTPVNAVAAHGTITVSGTPVADETLTIGSQVFTFKALRSVAGEITIDADNTTQGDNIVAAITADLTDVTAVNATGTVTVTAATAGAAGNAIALTENATGVAVSGSGTLAGGIDGTPGGKHDLMLDSSYLYVLTDNNTIAGANWRKIGHNAL